MVNRFSRILIGLFGFCLIPTTYTIKISGELNNNNLNTIYSKKTITEKLTNAIKNKEPELVKSILSLLTSSDEKTQYKVITKALTDAALSVQAEDILQLLLQFCRENNINLNKTLGYLILKTENKKILETLLSFIKHPTIIKNLNEFPFIKDHLITKITSAKGELYQEILTYVKSILILGNDYQDIKNYLLHILVEKSVDNEQISTLTIWLKRHKNTLLTLSYQGALISSIKNFNLPLIYFFLSLDKKILSNKELTNHLFQAYKNTNNANKEIILTIKTMLDDYQTYCNTIQNKNFSETIDHIKKHGINSLNNLHKKILLTVVSWAIACNNTNVLKRLLEIRLLENFFEIFTKKTMLEFAVENNSSNIISLILEHMDLNDTKNQELVNNVKKQANSKPYYYKQSVKELLDYIVGYRILKKTPLLPEHIRTILAFSGKQFLPPTVQQLVPVNNQNRIENQQNSPKNLKRKLSQLLK